MDTRLNTDGDLVGDVTTGETHKGALRDLMLAPESFRDGEQDDIAYWVESDHNGVEQGQSGGLFFGVSHLHAGTVGDEFIFTRGHYHEARDTGEYYWGLAGDGLLLLHFDDGNEKLLPIGPGIVRYIPGNVAHRLINIGDDTLSVGAVWQAVSGHDYRGALVFKSHVMKTGEGYRVINK
ncbi:hypothetical protein FC50_GL001197 [Lacticaseibacillus pantheris DSM 15945 = JCM 12539 = NBRC 106106]|uniref:glucose-6-phosphate isomerase n=1 Tax=Lacticaseibacillus pantheris DSM 15945 = JCM 12539 = NBRC 106106 TaxID=1423783 RepID=A0A0R1TYI5_9LACO|nr:glucose-6-phosphate isomerase family protein [Lacticaseibacillus pantheris]KRL85806.1 hypothetical protein FC50_GL001197 [Lacticaseibacillus pantheris DSM 15945 = JCM 12539 = NBRC 106106]